MKQGICPKCRSANVYSAAGSRLPNETVIIKDVFFTKTTTPDKYLCLECGYLEYYVPLTDETTQLVRDNWQRVAVRPESAQ